jgi:hypothetical protein
VRPTSLRGEVPARSRHRVWPVAWRPTTGLRPMRSWAFRPGAHPTNVESPPVWSSPVHPSGERRATDSIAFSRVPKLMSDRSRSADTDPLSAKETLGELRGVGASPHAPCLLRHRRAVREAGTSDTDLPQRARLAATFIARSLGDADLLETAVRELAEAAARADRAAAKRAGADAAAAFGVCSASASISKPATLPGIP